MREKECPEPSQFRPSEERVRRQAEDLAASLKRAYEQSLTGRELFERVHLAPADIKTLPDLARLPITRKNDIIELEKTRPFAGFLTIPVEEVNRVFVAPGPVYEPLHAENIPWFMETFEATGFGKGDIVVDTFSYHLSPGGLLFHEAIRQCGATAVPIGVGSTEILIRTMMDLRVTGFVGTPSYLLSVIKKAEEMGYRWRDSFALRKAWFTGEMLTPSIRQTLEIAYGINTSQAYAVSEVGGALAYECCEKKGLHLMDDYIIEIVDPVDGKPVTGGETGEIVVTPIANPTWGLFRFGTGDLSAIDASSCPCGRTSARLKGITGRVGDAVKVRGLFVVGKQVETVLAGFPEVGRYQLFVDRPQQRDEILINIELKNPCVEQENLAGAITTRFQAQCLIKPDRIVFVPAGVIEEGSRSIVDLRKWQ